MNSWVFPFPLQERERDCYTVTATCYEPIITTTCYEPPSYEDIKHIRYFNCKRCGAVGQQGVCEYCGSAE